MPAIYDTLNRKLSFEECYFVETNSGCWLWSRSLTGAGYGIVRAAKRAHLAHRLSYDLHVGPIPEGLDVLHKCDTPACIRPDHLFLGTHSENMADMASKNRAASGEENYHAKLKEDDIQKIRSSTLSTYKLAAKFGISQTQIRRVKDGTHWSTK